MQATSSLLGTYKSNNIRWWWILRQTQNYCNKDILHYYIACTRPTNTNISRNARQTLTLQLYNPQKFILHCPSTERYSDCYHGINLCTQYATLIIIINMTMYMPFLTNNIIVKDVHNMTVGNNYTRTWWQMEV